MLVTTAIIVFIVSVACLFKAFSKESYLSQENIRKAVILAAVAFDGFVIF